MALDTLSCAEELTENIAKACGHGSDGLPDPDETPDPSTWPVDFADTYNEYAMDGEVLGAINEGGDQNALIEFMTDIPQSTGRTPTEFAEALAQFWSEVALTPGEPFAGATSVEEVVENNALSLVSDFEAAIRASMTTEQDGPPYYKTFLDNVEEVVKDKMIWTVVQLHPGSPPYTVTHTVAIDQGEV